MKTCPRCCGDTILYPLIPNPKIKALLVCDVCDGKGKVTDKIFRLVEAGEKLRNIRVEKDLTLREFCEQNDLAVVEYSARERGATFKTRFVKL